MNYERSIKDTFIEYSKSFKSVLLTGPRQVGKTTLLLDIKEEERKYVTLDDLEIRRLAKENPKKFIETYSPPVIIDEIQYAPDLMSYIKIICDNTTKKGLFWLTGTQKIQVMKNVSETLAGRMGVLEMNSFSYKEITKIKYLPHDLNDLTLKEELTKEQVLKNIKALAKSLQEEGFHVVSDGTDNHLILVDVKSSCGINGLNAQNILDSINITVNKNAIPNDSESPMVTSGIRLGSPAMTTRGLLESDFTKIGKIIAKTLKNNKDENVINEMKNEVLKITKKYPLWYD